MNRMNLTLAITALVLFPLAAQPPKRDPKVEPEKTKLKPGDESPKQPAPLPSEKKEDSEESKIVDRLSRNSRSAEKRLGENDASEETRKLQREVLKDIDELIALLKQPPPGGDSSSDSSSGGGSSSQGGKSSSSQGGKSSPSSGGSAAGSGGGSNSGKQSLSRREQREQRRQNEQATAGSKSGPANDRNLTKNSGEKPSSGTNKSGDSVIPMNDNGKPGDATPPQNAGNSNDRKKENALPSDPVVAEFYKDIWGHLPEKMRQEMDAYFKERFMPRYSDLLRQYYSNIAEQNKK
jgi:hypothetical protein